MAKIGYHDNVLSDEGKPVQATITVYEAGTQNLATIYADPQGSTQKDNPFQTDTLGRFQFFADPGQYDIEVSGSGITTFKMEYISLSKVTKSTELTDMPQQLISGDEEKGLKVKSDLSGYELFTRTFLSLIDTFESYTGLGGKILGVKATEDGIEAVDYNIVPSGLIAIFQDDCPSGWTRVAAFDGKFLRGAASYGGMGGDETHGHGLGTLVVDSENLHTHQVNPPSQSSGGTTGTYSDSGLSAGNVIANKNHMHDVDIPQFSSGPGSAHAHGLSGALATANHLPPYIDVVFCQKN